MKRLAGLLCVAAVLTAAQAAPATELPPGFAIDAPITGVVGPTGIRFSPDGRVFVSRVTGEIMVYDGITDPNPKLFADLSPQVFGSGDRGLLGMVLDPDFPGEPWIYVSYSHDALPGGVAPHYADHCSASVPGCPIDGRVARLEADPQTGTAVLDPATGEPAETVLVTGWCQQYQSHSIGDLEFDPTGALIAGGGEGANYEEADDGSALNDCGDPPGEGGALRAQDLRASGDETGYSGALIRIDPATGDPLPTNPLFAGADAPARRILAYGFRNPFRFEFRPGTSDLYVGDVGWNSYEELDRIPAAPDQAALDFGWPCFEGPFREPDYEALGNPICAGLYAGGGESSPFFSYKRHSPTFPGDRCSTQSGVSSSGLAFYEQPAGKAGSVFPARYDGALFMADAARGCVQVMLPGPGGVPDPSRLENFAFTPTTPAGQGDPPPFVPVDLTEGPDGALYVPNFRGGEIDRIRSVGIEPIAAPVPAVRALLRLRSHPRGIPLRAGSVRHRAPFTRTLGMQAQVRVTAPRRVRRHGRTLCFRRWSDRGRRSHPVHPGGSRVRTAFYAATLSGCGARKSPGK